MFFPFIFTIILTEFQIINHICNSQNSKLDIYHNESIDYLISCSNKNIQKIDLLNTNHIRTIYVFKSSNVIFDCSSNIQQFHILNLLIFDKPNITFKGVCNIKRIDIFGSPKINLPQNNTNILTIEKINNYNSTYQLPFDSKQELAFHSTKKLNKFLKDSEFLTIYCNSDINFSLFDRVYVKCGEIFEFELEYEYFQYYYFTIYDSFVTFIKKIDFSLFDENFPKVFKSLFYIGKISFNFMNFVYADLIDNYSKYLNYDNPQIFISMNWSEIMDYSICPWTDGIFNTKYTFLKEYFDQLEENSNWRKMCLDQVGLLYNRFGTINNRIDISTTLSLIIIFSIILIIILFIISFFIIAYRKYLKEMKKEAQNKQ